MAKGGVGVEPSSGDKQGQETGGAEEGKERERKGWEM